MDGACVPQQSKRPCFAASRRGLHRHDALHRFYSVRQRPIIEKGPLPACVISDIRIAAVIARLGIAGHEHLTLREAPAETLERFQARWDKPQALSGHRTDDGLAGELLPPALGLAV